MKLAIALLAVLFLGTVNSASAESFTIKGEGLVTCGKWAELRKKEQEIPEIAWVLGYLTAYNLYVGKKSDIAEGTDLVSLEIWTDNYCSRHPLNSIFDSTQQLIAALNVRQHGGHLTNEYGD